MAATEPKRRTQRERQKERTRTAIVDAARLLADTGDAVTIPGVAAASGVSVATVYRHFPDLLELLDEALDRLDVDEVMAPVASMTDPASRVAHAAEALARRVAQREGAVRAVLAATVVRPDAGNRPGHRFALIERALVPWSDTADPDQLRELRRTLSIVLGAEALFILTDLHGLDTDEAISAIVRTARAITAAATEVSSERHAATAWLDPRERELPPRADSASTSPG